MFYDSRILRYTLLPFDPHMMSKLTVAFSYVLPHLTCIFEE